MASGRMYGNPVLVMLIDRIEYRDGWPQVEGGVPSEDERPAPAAS
jgi:hypothetical protein